MVVNDVGGKRLPQLRPEGHLASGRTQSRAEVFEVLYRTGKFSCTIHKNNGEYLA